MTILEEAHLLLRRTSTEQSQENSNLQGKAVEMLSNAIAEMRTYGECFIIADQAPSLLDTSVIRNTNTKIVMRLPEKNDRDAVGNSMALDELQIKQLSRLPNWKAAVYQSDWLEAVLCAIESFNHDMQSPYTYIYDEDEFEPSCLAECARLLLLNDDKENDLEIKELRLAYWYAELKQCSLTEEEAKSILGQLMNVNELEQRAKEKILYEVFNGKLYANKIHKLTNKENAHSMFTCLVKEFDNRYNLQDLQLSDRILTACYNTAIREIESLGHMEEDISLEHERFSFIKEGLVWKN